MKKSTLLHLRFPFSFFLLPVFLFGYSIDTNVPWIRFWSVFAILHLLVYPASNGYNSYFDKDEGSIGGLKTPPKTTKELYNTALILDTIAFIWALWFNIYFGLGVLLYGLVSKAYSHPSIRIKKHPISSWIIAGLFQGWFTLIISFIGLHDTGLEVFQNTQVQLAGLLSSAILWGSYPMTQIYQHEEDRQRGDITLSYKLGILGTFHFTAICFFFGSLGYLWYYNGFGSIMTGFAFLAFMGPVVGYFGFWYLKVRKSISEADFDHTMKLNLISSTCLNLFFISAAIGLI